MRSGMRILVALGILFVPSVYAKEVAQSAQIYYKSHALLQQPVKVIASDLDNVIVKRVKWFWMEPITSTIELYNSLKLPVVVWTNNDFSSYKSKLDTVKKKLNSLKPSISFEPKGVVVAGGKCKKGIARSKHEKPAESYYRKAYTYTKNRLKLGAKDVIVFVDDLAENVNAAREVARQCNLPIIAIQYKTAGQLSSDFKWLMSQSKIVGYSDASAVDLMSLCYMEN